MHAVSRVSRRGALLAAIMLVLAVPAVEGPAARPTPAYASSGISQHIGFGSCDIQNESQMQAFWSGTPYWNYELYIGGSTALCPVSSASFVSDLQAQGWNSLPLWVGPQAPCFGGVTFSWDLGTANTQGRNEAFAAYNKLIALGIDVTDTPVISATDPGWTGSSDGP